MDEYPKYKYAQGQDPIIVTSLTQEQALSGQWYDSPAEYGVETCPGVVPLANPVLTADGSEVTTLDQGLVNADATIVDPSVEIPG